MVAVITPSRSIGRILSYNENKVRSGVAECLGAFNMPLDHDRMDFSTKLSCLKKTLELRPDIGLNSVHVSLNFHPEETGISNDRMARIASEYMDGIGFSGQPFLVYRHSDAAHPHLHIVTIKIRPDGSRIDMQNIGRNQSEDARRSIEERHGLVRAERQGKEALFKLKPVSAERASYGRSQTKNAIQNVLANVLEQYRYASLPELNAVLRLYNVEAFAGEDGSRLKSHHGLLYRVLDGQGKPVGVPIKASAFYNSPGLKFLQGLYGPNAERRRPHAGKVRNAVDRILLDGTRTFPQLVSELERTGISVVARTNSEGLVYGLTYVDHRNRTVFNGSALGRAYSAKGLLERCGESPGLKAAPASLGTAVPPQLMRTGPAGPPGSPLLDALLQPEFVPEPLADHLRLRRRRRKKRAKNNPNT